MVTEHFILNRRIEHIIEPKVINFYSLSQYMLRADISLCS